MRFAPDDDEKNCAAWLGLVAIVVMVPFMAVAAPQNGYPIPRQERALVAAPTPRVGAWAVAEGVVTLVTPARPSSVLVVEDAAPASDAFLRARVVGAGRRDLAIVFRAVIREQPSLHVDGFAFFVRDDMVGLAPVRGTAFGEPVASARVPGFPSRDDVEIAIYGAGTHVAALVFDGRTKDLLTTVTASIDGDEGGRVVVIAGRGHAPTVALTLQTTAPTERVRPRESVPAEWTVELTKEHRVPRDVARIFRRVDRTARTDVFVTHEVGAFILTERGIPTVRAVPGVGQRYRDTTFSSRMRASVDARGAPRFVDGLKDAVMVERAIDALARAHPESAERIEIGRSREGRAIVGLRISDDLTDRKRPAVLLVGGHHADEVITPEAPLDAARVLLNGARDPQIARILRGFTVVVVPLVNPDGSHLYWHARDDLGRTNAARDDEARREGLTVYGVDLNRNYPFAFANVEDRYNSSDPRSRFYRGSAPASEPEVQAILVLADEMRFVAAISYHASATRILVPYTVEGAVNPEPTVAWTVAHELIAAIPDAMPGKRYVATRNLYPVGGTDQDALHHRHGTLAYLVEMPVRAPLAGAPLDVVLERSRPVWMFLFERWLSGPSLEVAVEGTSPDVEVSVDEIVWKNGERHTAHDVTRLWRTYLPAVGRYTVRARTMDGREKATVIDVGQGVTRVHIAFDDADGRVATD